MAKGIGLLHQHTLLVYHGFESHFFRYYHPTKSFHSDNFYSFFFELEIFGGIVQLVERMLCKHEVNGSSPFTSIRQKK